MKNLQIILGSCPGGKGECSRRSPTRGVGFSRYRLVLAGPSEFFRFVFYGIGHLADSMGPDMLLCLCYHCIGSRPQSSSFDEFFLSW
jgi:hypothetical protein